MSFEQKVENIWRRMLFLPKSPWVDESGVFSSAEHFIKTLDEQIEDSQNPALRFQVANSIHRAVFFKLPEYVRNLPYRASRRIDKFLFYRAKKLTYESYHYILRSGEIHIDGYLKYTVWGRDCQLSMDITSLGAIKADTEDDGFVMDLNESFKYGFPILLIPQGTFTADEAHRAIVSWYQQKVAYKPRHWTNRTGQTCMISVNFEYDENAPTDLP